jgi:hypothetical protein
MNRSFSIGDVFEARVDSSAKRFFQYVGRDATQLDSHVVRVFRTVYDASESPSLRLVVADDIDFHAHVLLGLGIKQQAWIKVGHEASPRDVDVLFRDTNDFGNPAVAVSGDWFVWRVNKPAERVGKLGQRYREAEIGVVVPPDSLIHRMRSGRYDFAYPDQ